MTNFAGKVPIKLLDRRSDEWKMYHTMLDRLWAIYCGGLEMQAMAEQFLIRRAKEPAEVFQSRIANFQYHNHAGTATDWYVSALFQKPPRSQPSPPPGAADGKIMDLKPDDAAFQEKFDKNCNRAKQPFLEHLRMRFRDMVVFGRAVSLVDLPRAGEFPNLKAEREAGQFDPYLCAYDPRCLINYQRDDEGSLKWAVLRALYNEQEDAFTETSSSIRWYYFDRTSYAVYEKEIKDDKDRQIAAYANDGPDGAEGDAVLVDSGSHALAEVQQVPLLITDVPRGFWFAQKAYSAVIGHINADNDLAWALKMAALAMPVIISDEEVDMTLSEVGAIHLPKDAKYEWTEPEGRCWKHLDNRTNSLVEQIFRHYYLISQARSTSATPAAQSGISKEQDMKASRKILSALGAIVREDAQQTLNAVWTARRSAVRWDVRGLDFPEEPPDETLEMIGSARSVGVNSDTFQRELSKLAVTAAIPDANTDLKTVIFKEIDDTPIIPIVDQTGAVKETDDQLRNNFPVIDKPRAA